MGVGPMITLTAVKFVRRLVLTIALSAVLLPLLPGQSRAAALRFFDSRGDANWVGLGFESPHPSDPELDVVAVGFATEGDALVLTMEVDKFGVPIGTAAASFVWNFKYNDVLYGVTVSIPAAEEAAFPGDPFFYRRERANAGSAACEGCVARHDPRANVLRAVLPLKSMSAIIREGDPSQPELRTGSELEDLWVFTDRLGTITPVGDYADAGRRKFTV